MLISLMSTLRAQLLYQLKVAESLQIGSLMLDIHTKLFNKNFINLDCLNASVE